MADRKRILVADDDPDLLELLRMDLSILLVDWTMFWRCWLLGFSQASWAARPVGWFLQVFWQ